MPANVPRTKVCTGWCGPTIIYAILAASATVISFIHPDLKSHQERGVVFLANAINGLFWTGVLYFLCKNCWYNAAWFLLLIPFVIAFIMLLFVTAIALSVLRNKSGGHIDASVSKEEMTNMANYENAYGAKFASVPGSQFPDQVLDLQKERPSPHSPTHVKGVCGYSARPSKFNVLTQQQLQSPGSYMIMPGAVNTTVGDSDTPSGCHEGYPPNPIQKYAMPSDNMPIAS